MRQTGDGELHLRSSDLERIFDDGSHRGLALKDIGKQRTSSEYSDHNARLRLVIWMELGEGRRKRKRRKSRRAFS